MVKLRWLYWIVLGTMLPFYTAFAAQQQAGSIRGVVYDKDFDAPLGAAQILIVETGQKVTSTDQGNYVLSQVPPGKYTLVFSKEGYVRQVKADVVVSAGRLTDLNISLSGDFTEMDEFVVQDILQLAAGTEASLLKLRFESPSLMDSISSDLMSRAGASDAASALKLVTGATVKEGKFAVIRGLPDRYVSTQLNSVRLPSADEDTRSVELDQYPAAVIESIQVSKTFTPDQQGDASGGAVNVVVKSIPDRPLFFQFKSEIGYNSNVRGRSDFLSYDGGGVNFWGNDDSRDIQWEKLGESWDGAAGVSTQAAPTDYKWSWAAGGKHEFENGLKVGGFVNFFYERDSSYYDDGIEDSLWILGPGQGLTPKTTQGVPPEPGVPGNFKTSLFNVTQGVQSVQWGGLVTGGVEYEKHAVNMAYLYTRTTEDKATLSIDTRGKLYWFPDYDPNDPTGPGNQEPDWAPWLRLETLDYTEREIETLIFDGKHTLPTGEFEITDLFEFSEPEFDWTLSRSSARLDQPDKRLFSALWKSAKYNEGVPPWVPPSTDPPEWFGYKPSANFNLGFFQRIWKEIEEESDQYTMNLKMPFEQWSGEKGYLKLGLFDDRVDREFDQNTFSNLEDNSSYVGDWDEPWSEVFPFEDHPIQESNRDVDYEGKQDIFAWYTMMDLPLTSSLSMVGGVRWEYTDIKVANIPEEDATWFPPGELAEVSLNPGDADVDFSQDDALPSIGLVYTPAEQVTLRGSYSETIARQTFKELTPILQQEYLGAPYFIGNPFLKMAALRNYDIRMDYEPYEGGLISLSLSYFYKDVDDPIEYVQKVAPNFDYTTAVNYPEGELKGYEVEVRQGMGQFWDSLEGLSLGGNATFIDSEVKLPADEVEDFADPAILAPRTKRDATAAPEHLYNLFTTYDMEATGTQLGLFYTVTGDTLVAGAGISSEGFLVPDVYARSYDTLNLTVSQKLGQYVKLQFKAKNLTNPKIKTEYRPQGGGDMVKSSYTKGVDYSISVTVEYRF